MRRALIAAAVLLSASVPALAGAVDAAPPTSSFIVVLQPGTQNVPAVAAQLAASARGNVGFVYEHALQGFSLTASDAAASALARNPRVAYVERDQEVTLAGVDSQDVPTGIERIFAPGNAIVIDGIDDVRVDVDVAVIDTGVDLQHPDLNVVEGVNCATGNWRRSSCSPGGDDDHYHGTHVAGTIAALDNGIGVVGVAPGATIYPVKVLNSRGSGYTSWIVAGIDWVTGRGDIEVANMSLGGSGYSQSEYDAIQGAVDSGVAFAVAAGNDNDDARNYSPGGFDNVLSVSALADFDGLPGDLGTEKCRPDQDDTLADFSNWGPEVDIAAPGVCILSTYPIEQGSYGTISGTSMASPHVAGALALLASNTPNDVTKDSEAGAVYGLYGDVTNNGNFGWSDDERGNVSPSNGDSRDGIKEPLLDVSDSIFFKPKMETVGGPTNQIPTITITSPSDRAIFDSGVATINLNSTAGDPNGDLESVVWTANGIKVLSGESGTWQLPADGPYDLVATATDSYGATATDSVSITVGTTQPPPESVLTPSSQNNGKTWTAIVTSTVDVSGTWTVDSETTSDFCSATSGACQVSLSGISKKVSSVTFTPTDPAGTSVEVFKP